MSVGGTHPYLTQAFSPGIPLVPGHNTGQLPAQQYSPTFSGGGGAHPYVGQMFSPGIPLVPGHNTGPAPTAFAAQQAPVFRGGSNANITIPQGTNVTVNIFPNGGQAPLPQQQFPGWPPQQQLPAWPPQQQFPSWPPQQQMPAWPPQGWPQAGGYPPSNPGMDILFAQMMQVFNLMTEAIAQKPQADPAVTPTTPTTPATPQPTETGVTGDQYVASSLELDNAIDSLIARTGETDLKDDKRFLRKDIEDKSNYINLLTDLKNSPTEANYKRVEEFMKQHDASIPDDLYADLIDLKDNVATIGKYENAPHQRPAIDNITSTTFRDSTRANANLMRNLEDFSYNSGQNDLAGLVDKVRKNPTQENYQALLKYVQSNGEVPPEYFVQLKEHKTNIDIINAFKEGKTSLPATGTGGGISKMLEGIKEKLKLIKPGIDLTSEVPAKTRPSRPQRTPADIFIIEPRASRSAFQELAREAQLLQ